MASAAAVGPRGRIIQSLLIDLLRRKKLSLPPWQADRKPLCKPVGVDGAMRPRMIKHGYRPAKNTPVTDDRSGSGG
jgi:hypothetical protein